MALRQNFLISDTSPAAAGNAAGDAIGGLHNFDFFMIDAALVGATGGTLDVYLQREVGDLGSGTWRDWLHFPQLAAGAAAVYYSLSTGADKTIVVVGNGGTPALAVNTFVGGHPGYQLRAYYVAGASTSAGAAVAINIMAWRNAVRS